MAEDDCLAMIFGEESAIARPIKLRAFGGFARVQEVSVVALGQRRVNVNGVIVFVPGRQRGQEIPVLFGHVALALFVHVTLKSLDAAVVIPQLGLFALGV